MVPHLRNTVHEWGVERPGSCSVAELSVIKLDLNVNCFCPKYSALDNNGSSKVCAIPGPFDVSSLMVHRTALQELEVVSLF